jgi:hypothetical protein
MNTAPFPHLLNPQLPPHIVQSDDLQYLTCRKCNVTVCLPTEPNYRVFIWEHAHIPPYPKAPPPKPWPSYPE